ncbi:PREDICTED: uncharacterized protein LOC106741179 [Dinoponera quadriceps]|uniref:Uncharacterized protein LOC106741179 n=1 Tax=Dinoponera quadriceps TaxID=609295 RepID=A0A6P3WQN8_DINQU|nr:PREDICTED: uncharacterized protein LOC106741179 [Dinoponera quadriceps]
MDADNQACHGDPQFMNVLETCLKMEIRACREKLAVNSLAIARMRTKIRNEISRRKQLKEQVAQMQKINVRLNESLTRLHISNSETTNKVEAMRANIDDQYKLMELRAQEYQDIIADYKNTSDAYHAMYEEFPLAKARNAAKISLRKLQIEHMVMTYKKTEMVTIIQQRQRINWVRMRCKIIEFVYFMAERLKLEERLTRLRGNVNHHRKELQSLEMEIQAQHKRQEDQRRLRKQMLEMAPPKINIPYQQMYVRTPQTHIRVQHQWLQAENFDDNVSINTMALEELCITESTIMSPEEINVESVHEKDPEYTVVQTESHDPKTPAVPEKTNTPAASAAPADVETDAVERTASADNDVEMKEIHRDEETSQQSQQSAKTQTSPRTKGSLLKHSAATSTQDEIEAKRMRLQRKNSEGSSSNRINVLRPSIVAQNDNAELLKSSTSVPKIRKVETVHYNVPLLPNLARRPSGATSNIFSPPHYEFCESNLSSFDQDFAKGCSMSLYDGSLCNYRLSPISNVSPIRFEGEAPTAPPTKPLQQDDKKQPDDKMSIFHFNDFAKKPKSNFTLF